MIRPVQHLRGVTTQYAAKYKLIVSGNVVEEYRYQYPIQKGRRLHRVGRAGRSATAEQKAENVRKNIFRARKKVRNLANSNFDRRSKFVTLTFAENLTDLQRSAKLFKEFIQRMVYRYGSFAYLAVPEFQKRGAVHFHMLCNLPYIENATLQEVWGNGFVKINAIDNVDNIGAYISKYMVEDMADERLNGRKHYYCSKGLQRPIELTRNYSIDFVMCKMQEIGVVRVRTANFQTEFNGRVVYTQYVLQEAISRDEVRKKMALAPRLGCVEGVRQLRFA